MSRPSPVPHPGTVLFHGEPPVGPVPADGAGMVRSGRSTLVQSLLRHGSAEVTPVARDLVVQQSSDTVVVIDKECRIMDLNTAGDLLIRRLVSGAPEQLTGLDARALLGHRLPKEALVDGEYEMSIDGRDVVFDVRVTRLTGRRDRPIGTAYVVRDVTDVVERRKELAEVTIRLVEQEELVKRLQHDLLSQENQDPLTGLHNRRYLVERLSEEIERAEFDGGLSVVMLDIDDFKSVNDQYGHTVGDELLSTVAKGLAETVRSRDVLARYGGVEFVLVLPGASSEQACARAEQLRLRCDAITVQTTNGPISRTISAGVAAFPAAGRTPSAILSAADQAMYMAKASGRDRVSLADHTYVGGR